MSRHKMTRAMLVAVAVWMLVGLVGASSASAALELSSELCNGSTLWGLCWSEKETVPNPSEELKELKGTGTITAKGGTNLFVVSAIPVEIECTGVESGAGAELNATSPLGTGDILTGSLRFTGCKLVGTNAVATKCVIPTAETTKPLTGAATSETAVLLKPTTGEVFVEITFTSKEGQTCPATVIGKRKVTGAEEVTIVGPKATLGSKKGKSVVLSELLFIEKQAELTGEIEVTFAETEPHWIYLWRT
jgi:hypothetical protein